MTCITTYTQKHFDPVNPDMDKVDIIDIAHALSYLCRGNGHVVSFFSVAQHCIHCAKEAEARGYSYRIVLACLLHDASEVYMSDVPRPFKQMLKDYIDIEENLINQIYQKYLGSSLDEQEKQVVRDIDNDMLKYDLKYLLHENIESLPKMKAQFTYEVLPFETVETMYLTLFNTYRKEI